ncbi:hypothetical protein RZE82_05040 [Mollicutes bacterium LVI A0039]|nr:hypothetical protein RZE82_05040 [Mollicutes bacterium LVI A0039]
MGKINKHEMNNEFALIIEEYNMEDNIWFRIEQFASNVTIFDLKSPNEICIISYKKHNYLIEDPSPYQEIVEGFQKVFDQFTDVLKEEDEYDDLDQQLIEIYESES